MVGYGTRDDAAVYRINARTAVVETVDFFPPVVDDPFTFGEIAAANAMSDIWAMGAKPLFALNLAAFPRTLPLSILGKILAGGQSKANEAGIPILGGHTIEDPEPKYGMAVTGIIDPRKILTNAAARPGDALLLTKPLGSGIATTAMKRGLASPELTKTVTRMMSTLNKKAGEVLASGRFTVHALTDVTGFGLLGHLVEMMDGSRCRAVLYVSRIPVLSGVPELAAADVVPAGSRANLDFVAPKVRFQPDLPPALRLILADAQTNGGLLASIPRTAVKKALSLLERVGVEAIAIGEVESGKPGVNVVE